MPGAEWIVGLLPILWAKWLYDQTTKLHELILADIPKISAAFARLPWSMQESLYQHYLSEVSKGSREIIVARYGG